MLVGASRKRFLGALLADAAGRPRPVHDRDRATDAISALAAAAGAWCVRVHEARSSADAVRVAARWSASRATGRPAGHTAMTDRITVTGIRGFGRHGWFAFETEQGQEFVVDVVLEVDHTAAAASDDLADTVDYGGLGERVVALIEGGPHRLIETLAARIAECLPGGPARGARRGDRAQAAGADAGAVRRRGGDRGAGAPPVTAVLRPAVLALGSNLPSSAGDPFATLCSAVDHLARELWVSAVSPVYETDPVGGPAGQPAYLNAVVLVETQLSAHALLDLALRVEAAHGRVRAERWGAAHPGRRPDRPRGVTGPGRRAHAAAPARARARVCAGPLGGRGSGGVGRRPGDGRRPARAGRPGGPAPP